MTTQIHPSDAHQSHSILQANAAKLTALREINAGYLRFVGASQTMAAAIIDQANEARSIGLHLIELKKTSRRGFEMLFASVQGRPNQASMLAFSVEHGRRFMRHALRYPEPITKLRDGVTSVTQLMLEDEESSRGQQRSRGALNWLTGLQKQLMGAMAIFGKQAEKIDVDHWSRAETESIEAQTRPFAEIHAKALQRLSGASAPE